MKKYKIVNRGSIPDNDVRLIFSCFSADCIVCSIYDFYVLNYDYDDVIINISKRVFNNYYKDLSESREMDFMKMNYILSATLFIYNYFKSDFDNLNDRIFKILMSGDKV